MSNESRKPYPARVGDTLTAFGMILQQSGNPVDLTGKTVKFRAVLNTGPNLSGAVIVDNNTANVQVQPTNDFTVDTVTGYLLCNEHVVKDGMQIVLTNSGGGLPGGLNTSRRYFATQVKKNAFKLAAYEGDSAPVTISTAGTGTHSFYIVGHAQFDWRTADAAEERPLRCWFKVFEDDECQSFPSDKEGWPVWMT